MTGRAPRRFSRQPISELPASLMAEDWGAGLLAILARATQDRTADRYRTVQEFWEDFAQLKLGEAVAAQAGDEATIVRRRLSGTSTMERAAAQPRFHAITTGSHEASRAQKARIIVNIPLPEKPAARPEAGRNGAAPAEVKAATDAVHRSPYATVRDTVAPAGVVEEAQIKPQAADALRTRRMKERAAPERSFSATLQAVVRSDWLRRVFIVLLFAAVIGLASSIYHHFADRQRPGLPDSSITGKDGVIGGALNVNLRSDPGGAVLTVLPVNSRVRVLEERGNWIKVQVLKWPNGQPPNLPDTGWVNKQFVDTD